jgi:LmbE family N-acetylglucosaminyl deacetylase
MTTILGLWAHPDDEVFVSGGMMAEAVRRGDRVVCVHMTRGESGLLYRRQPSSRDTLARIRERELGESLARLGVSEQRFLDYEDGHLIRVPSHEGIARIQEEFLRVRPDVVLTFGPDGFTGHPDHKVLSAWVTAAYRVWSDPYARLYHSVVSRAWRDAFVHRLNEFDFFWPEYPMADDSPDLTLKLNANLLAAKLAALREHSSQMQPLFDSYGDGFMRAVASVEQFRLVDGVHASPLTPASGRGRRARHCWGFTRGAFGTSAARTAHR